MNVLIISPCGLPVPAVKGGAVLTLIESLLKQNEKYKKLEFTVIGSFDREAIEEAKKYKTAGFIFLKQPALLMHVDNLYEALCVKLFHRYHKTPHRYLWKLYVIQKIRKILKKQDFDRVVFENAGFLLNILKDKAVAKKYAERLYYHVHNDIPDNIYLEGVRQCKLLLISNYLRKKIEDRCGKMHEAQVFILRNGIDYACFSQGMSKDLKKSLKQELNISEDKKVVVFAGRIDPTKGIEQLANAFVKMQRKDTILLIIGSHCFGAGQTSPFEIRMKQLFNDMKSQACFTGYIQYMDMWKYYKISDIAVLPSMWEEPAGLTIIEAMSAGLPIISTISGGIPELLNDRYGILLQRDTTIETNLINAITTMLDNLEEWKKKGSAASEYIGPIVDEVRYYINFCDCLLK